MKISRTVKTLKSLAKIKGIKQRELAEKLGVAEASISRWFKGERQPSIDVVERMVLVLDSELCLIFRG